MIDVSLKSQKAKGVVFNCNGQSVMTRADAGRIGGNVTLQRYGRGQLAAWGSLGGRPRALTYNDIRQQQLLEGNNDHKEVKGPPGSLSELKRLHKLGRRSSGGEITQAGIAQETPRGRSLPERIAVHKPLH